MQYKKNSSANSAPIVVVGEVVSKPIIIEPHDVKTVSEDEDEIIV